ncbi:DUF6586 family protein [Bacterioplanoides sp.]|uniref:DUF6586 family protein n=1 Tax=Bacterioplanoides sp. TaxID=2066072 RepID=UPI003B00DFBC
MASWLSFTNHKLYQSRLLLQQAEQTSNPVVLQQALHDSALYLLRDAYQSYLHELAELANFRQPFTSLHELLSLTPLITGEMREFEQLENDSFSWLSAMLTACVAAGNADALDSQVPRTVQPGMINLLDTSEPQTAYWHGQLSQLIDLQRENRQES